jgi:hypothetical protein
MLCINGFDQYRYGVVQPDLYYTCAKLNPHGGTETGPLKSGILLEIAGYHGVQEYLSIIGHETQRWACLATGLHVTIGCFVL